MKFSTLSLIVLAMADTAFAAVFSVSSVADIRSAMASAVAGDEILVQPGTYSASDTVYEFAHFGSGTNAASNARITMRSADPNNKAVLEGDDVDKKYVLRIEGDYWTVKDLVFRNAQKGIIFDNAHHGEIIGCEVYNVGKEAIHIRDGSDYCLVEDCYVHDTGLKTPGHGEAIYIGTDNGAWNDWDKDVYHTTVRGCTLGPNVRAEAFDIKEGTIDTLIEYNTVDATGISGDTFADSFVDLKGIRTIVRYNTFRQNGASNLDKGIATVDRDVAGSTYEHAIHDNTFYIDSNVPIMKIDSDSTDIYAWDNTRIPSNGDTYDGDVITQCCPPWYSPNPNTPPPAPTPTSPGTTPAPTPAPTPPTGTGDWTGITYDDFEGGMGSFVLGGSDSELYTDGAFAHQGNNAIQIQDDRDGSVVTHTSSHDVSGFNQLRVQFWFIADDMDDDEDFWLQVSSNGGSQWTTVATWTHDVDFVNGQFYNEEVLIDASQLSNVKLRFRCDASNNNDKVYIDEVRFDGKA